MRGSCSVTKAIPVHKHVVHITFVVPKQVLHTHLDPVFGSINLPGLYVFGVAHSAQVK